MSKPPDRGLSPGIGKAKGLEKKAIMSTRFATIDDDVSIIELWGQVEPLVRSAWPWKLVTTQRPDTLKASRDGKDTSLVLDINDRDNILTGVIHMEKDRTLPAFPSKPLQGHELTWFLIRPGLSQDELNKSFARMGLFYHENIMLPGEIGWSEYPTTGWLTKMLTFLTNLPTPSYTYDKIIKTGMYTETTVNMKVQYMKQEEGIAYYRALGV